MYLNKQFYVQNFGTINECLVGTVGFQGFKRFYFVPTRKYLEQLILRKKSHQQQVGIVELEEIPAETVVEKGVHQWQMLNTPASNHFMNVTAANSSYSMMNNNYHESAIGNSSVGHFYRQEQHQIPAYQSQLLLHQNQQQLAFGPSSSSTFPPPVIEQYGYGNSQLINREQLMYNHNASHIPHYQSIASTTAPNNGKTFLSIFGNLN